jgi:alpha-glucosidase
MAWDQVEMCFDTIFKQYKDWGVDGVKIDFMDRSDQWMMSWYEKVMKEATKHQLLVDFHGSITPKGLEREYPNLVSYEGVRGIENGTDCKPSNSIYLPFIRNVVGAMDFTPGSMNSLHQENAHSTPELPSGIGTRAYQMALYIVFESGVQMLADSPSAYRTAPECTKFISETPVVWDETRVLNAELGESIVFARRSGDVWFVGGITDENSREIEISLDFLPEGKFTLTSFEDGVNANRIAKDYKKTVREVNASQKLTLKMAREGGWVGKFEPVK